MSELHEGQRVKVMVQSDLDDEAVWHEGEVILIGLEDDCKIDFGDWMAWVPTREVVTIESDE